MAIVPATKYPGRTNPPSLDYPHGSAKNVAVPGDGTGTPWEEAIVNDWLGFLQAILSSGGVAPSGNPDTALTSQYLLSLSKAFRKQLTFTTDILAADLTGIPIVSTLTYESANDEGGSIWAFTGTVTPGLAGTVDFDNGVLYDSEGNQFKYGLNILDPVKFGVKIDGVTDAAAKMQSVINYAELTDFAIRSKSGVMALSAGLTAEKGIDWQGLGGGTVGTGSVAELRGTILKSIGASTLLTLKGASAGDIIKNARLNNVSFDGNFTAIRGLLASTLYESTFKNLIAEKLSGAQFAFELNDDRGNISLKNIFENCHYNSTANPAAINSNGFAFKSTNAAGGGCVQNKIINCSALVQNGVAWSINGSDNNVFESIQSFVTGTGFGCRLSGGGVGATYARNNQFIVPVTDFVAETGTYGNKIFTTTSEVFELTAQADSQIHYELFDYVESSQYETHKYEVTDYHEVVPGDAQPVGAATRSAALSLWDSIQLPESADGGMIFNMATKYGWKNGKVKAIEISFISDGANVSAQAQFRLRAEVLQDNSPAATPEVDRTFLVNVNDAVNCLTVATENLGVDELDIGAATDRALALRLERNPGAVNDTCTSNLFVTGIRLFFQFDGPINGQTVDVTLPYKNF